MAFGEATVGTPECLGGTGTQPPSAVCQAEARGMASILDSLEAAASLVGHLGAPDLGRTLDQLVGAVSLALAAHTLRTERECYPAFEERAGTRLVTALLRWQHRHLAAGVERLSAEVLALQRHEPSYQQLAALRARLCGLGAELAVHLEQEVQVAGTVGAA